MLYAFNANVYAASGLTIKPKTCVSKIDALKEITHEWRMNPEEILAKEASIVASPHISNAYPKTKSRFLCHANFTKGVIILGPK